VTDSLDQSTPSHNPDQPGQLKATASFDNIVVFFIAPLDGIKNIDGCNFFNPTLDCF